MLCDVSLYTVLLTRTTTISRAKNEQVGLSCCCCRHCRCRCCCSCCRCCCCRCLRRCCCSYDGDATSAACPRHKRHSSHILHNKGVSLPGLTFEPPTMRSVLRLRAPQGTSYPIGLSKQNIIYQHVALYLQAAEHTQ